MSNVKVKACEECGAIITSDIPVGDEFTCRSCGQYSYVHIIELPDYAIVEDEEDDE